MQQHSIRRDPKLDALAHMVAEKRQVSRKEFYSKCRSRRIAWARHEFMDLARTSGETLESITNYLDLGSHKSVSYGISAHREREEKRMRAEMRTVKWQRAQIEKRRMSKPFWWADA